jgi:hypothetical protein
VIRPAKAADAFALADLLAARHKDTRYWGEVGIDMAIARKTFAFAAQRHAGTNDGATFLLLDEDAKGIRGFILAGLSRVYLVGDKLASCDQFLLGRKGCPERVLVRLFDQYVAWAAANPKVYEIGASWANTIPGSEGFAKVFARRGFNRIGETWGRIQATEQRRLAA